MAKNLTMRQLVQAGIPFTFDGRVARITKARTARSGSGPANDNAAEEFWQELGGMGMLDIDNLVDELEGLKDQLVEKMTGGEPIPADAAQISRRWKAAGKTISDVITKLNNDL